MNKTELALASMALRQAKDIVENLLNSLADTDEELKEITNKANQVLFNIREDTTDDMVVCVMLAVIIKGLHATEKMLNQIFKEA